MLAKIFKARHDCILNRFCCCENLSAVKSFTSKASTVKSKVKKWRKIFSQSNIAEPDASAEYIVSHVLGKKTVSFHLMLYLHFQDKIDWSYLLFVVTNHKNFGYFQYLKGNRIRMANNEQDPN